MASDDAIWWVILNAKYFGMLLYEKKVSEKNF